MTHTIKHPHGKSFNVQTPTHVDDHPSDDDWFRKNKPYIDSAMSAAGLAVGVAGLVLTHKPRR